MPGPSMVHGLARCHEVPSIAPAKGAPGSLQDAAYCACSTTAMRVRVTALMTGDGETLAGLDE